MFMSIIILLNNQKELTEHAEKVFNFITRRKSFSEKLHPFFVQLDIVYWAECRLYLS